MEFHEKLQALRRQRGLTQEELAAELFVSRTAISKWESGRGYPSIDSLKAISGFFSVSIDAFLSGEEVLTIAREEQQTHALRAREQVFGLLDCAAALLLTLPLFGQQTDDAVRAVSIFALTAVRPYLRALFWAVILGTMALGICLLALHRWEHPLWVRHRTVCSLGLSIGGVLLFLVSRQPYAAAFSFVFLAIKAWMLLKKP